MFAYDLETTRIQAGTPRPLYLTGYGHGWSVDGPIRSMSHLARIVVERFLIDEHRGCKYVAWNGNRFDAYIMAISLLDHPEYLIRPYMTRGNALRGLRIQHRDDPKGVKGWEFTCGIAMLGLEGVTLEKFLSNFAPLFRKLKEAIDFEKEQFNPRNKKHRAYAFRDSEGLFHGMQRAQSIMLETFNAPLGVTMGGACIKIFQANLPKEATINPLDARAEGVFRDFVMRGGFCYCARRYQGAIWKYDINQAYAAAMREDPMPAGQAIHTNGGVHRAARIFVARVVASNPDNKIPFYYRTRRGSRLVAVFGRDRIEETWLTSTEIRQLAEEGWHVKVFEAYQWTDQFTMQEFVDRLETLRRTCEGGPSGAVGTMVKATGNHAYGKTVEESSAMDFMIARESPGEDWEPYFGDSDDPIKHVWFRFSEDQRSKEYHAVQLGAFITASVRMKVRRVALLNPDSWLYADTDCVMFDSDMTDQLDIDPARYGAWKIEETGKHFRVIAKKVYSEVMDAPDMKPAKRSAKGLNVKKLTDEDFARWLNGEPPVQEQIQRNNFLAVTQSAEMFRAQVRRGTSVEPAK